MHGDFPLCHFPESNSLSSAVRMNSPKAVTKRLGSLSERTCWVCFATEEDEPGSEWTSPCRCKGATKWVHQVCLQQWIDEKQRGASTITVDCPQCQFTYHIQYPSASLLLLLHEYSNRVLTFCSPMLLAGITASGLYWISFTYGVTAASMALGRERSIEFFSNPDSSLVVVTLPLLPWAILGLKVLRLEVQVLRIWYRYLRPATDSILKKFHLVQPAISDVGQPSGFMPRPIPVLPFLSRCILGTFFFPIVSSLIGTALSQVSSQSTLKRTLMIPLIVVVDRMDHAITTMSPLVVSVLGVTSVYYVAFSYGLGVIALLYGRNGASQVVSSVSTNPLLVVAGVPLIPVGLVTLEAIDLEGRALNVWRTNVSPVLPRLPLVGRPIEWLWPTPTREPLASSQDGLGGAIDVMARSVSSGLLLPFVAYFVGRYCFKSIPSNATRVILGGLLFYVLKTFLKMYLRQQQHRRQGSRRVLDYMHEP